MKTYSWDRQEFCFQNQSVNVFDSQSKRIKKKKQKKKQEKSETKVYTQLKHEPDCNFNIFLTFLNFGSLIMSYFRSHFDPLTTISLATLMLFKIRM